MTRAVFLFLFFTLNAFAARSELVELENGQKVFADYRAPERGQPTLVLLNGLTYSLGDWDAYAASLARLRPGIGILRYDMIGMGDTLLNGKLPVSYSITHAAQVKLLQNLLDHFKIRQASLVGLSYGGAIAIAFADAHPTRVSRLVLMGPLTEPLTGMDP